MPLKRYKLVVLLGGVSRFSINLNLRREKMQKENQITLGHYTEKKLRELTKCEKGELELVFGYGLGEKRIEKTGMPKIPVFGFASQHTPADILADGYIPSRELIEYWKGTTWQK
jgi:hypothetical protein